MESISAFTEYLQQNNHPDDVGFAALSNYCRFLYSPETPFSAEIINGFYRHSLAFTYWQENKKALQQMVTELLRSFAETGHLLTDQENLTSIEDLQIFKIEQKKEFQLFLKNQLNLVPKETAKATVLAGDDDECVVVYLYPDQSIVIRQLSPLVYLKNGEWQPLLPGFELHYSAEHALSSMHRHHLRLDPFTSAVFTYNQDTFSGSIVKGYTFAKQDDIQAQKLSQVPRLFNALKKLERIYFEPKTDPFYRELMRDLERATENIDSSHPAQQKFIVNAYYRGKNAVEEIYHNDKILSLLVKNLEQNIFLRSYSRKNHWPTPTSQINENSDTETWQIVEPSR